MHGAAGGWGGGSSGASANASASATTDSQGQFTLDCGTGGCAQLPDSALVLLPADNQPGNCSDALTGEHLAYSLAAPLLLANLTAAAAPSNGSGGGGDATPFVTVSPLTTQAATAAELPGAGASQVAQRAYDLLQGAGALGQANASVAAFGNPLQVGLGWVGGGPSGAPEWLRGCVCAGGWAGGLPGG